MKNLRLTKTLRGEIIENLVEDLIAPAMEIEKQIQKGPFGDYFLFSYCSKEDIERAWKLRNSDQSWLNIGKEVHCRLEFNNKDTSLLLKLSQEQPVPGSVAWGYDSPFYLSSYPGYQELRDLVTKAHSIRDEAERVRDEMHEVLWTANTLLQVKKVWPSVVDYLPEYCKK